MKRTMFGTMLFFCFSGALIWYVDRPFLESVWANKPAWYPYMHIGKYPLMGALMCVILWFSWFHGLKSATNE